MAMIYWGIKFNIWKHFYLKVPNWKTEIYINFKPGVHNMRSAEAFNMARKPQILALSTFLFVW